MKTGKLCLAALLGAMPAMASAQSINVDVGVNVGADNFDTVAPGDPVESVDVFYDQLSPYGVWVDEPDVGRVFIPDAADYVPYSRGHWEYTRVGFVWVSSEPFGWATSHYGRWAYSRFFGRWYWLPDTEWGPAWVEWREAGDDFGWAPLPPETVVRAGGEPPVESWHYCGAAHILDRNVIRYYEPRQRVVEIHRQARPIEHYATVSNVKVIVGPPAARLREHRVAVRPVKVEARTVGRWSANEARAQVERAREHRTTFEAQNQQRIEARPQIHTAQTKVVESHPQIKAKVTARVQGRPEPAPATPAPNRVEPGRPAPGQPAQRAEPNRPAEPQHVQPGRPGEPQRAEPDRNAEPQHAQPGRQPEPPHAQPGRQPEPPRHEPARPVEPPNTAPRPPEHPTMPRPTDQPPQPPTRAPDPTRNEPVRNADPQHAQPARPAEPPRGNDRKKPDRKDKDKDDRH